MTQTQKKTDRLSQNAAIAKHLKSGKSLSPLRALDLFGCFRLASRIYNLKNPPYNLNIQSELVSEYPVKFARYYIPKPKRKRA
jgi:hypothetical protein